MKHNNLFLSVITGLLVFVSFALSGQPGALDPTFAPGAGATGSIHTGAVQPDGKIIIGGVFTAYNGTARNHIARLNADGSLDTSFNPGTGANHFIYTSVIQSDGKIIVGGDFTKYNGISRNRIARLNADGSLDATFNPGSGANWTVRATALQADGKIIIVGDFATYNSSDRNGIARLNPDGSLDTSFNPGTGITHDGWWSNIVTTVNLQADGKIIVGGNFDTYNETRRNGIARLNQDGSLDDSFDPGTGIAGGIERRITTVALQSDGKMIIGGSFGTYNGTTIRGIARLNQNGSIDISFTPPAGTIDLITTTSIQAGGKIIAGGTFWNPTTLEREKRIIRLNQNGSVDSTFSIESGTDGSIHVSILQTNGKIIIGGEFTYYNGTGGKHIARLNENGSRDAAFAPGTGASGTGANDFVRCIAIQEDGKILVGGRFTRYNHIFRPGIARLLPDGSLDDTFISPHIMWNGPSLDVYTIAMHDSGRVLIGGDFQFHFTRLLSNGEFDLSFNRGMGVVSGAGYMVYSSAVQPDGKIIIVGGFNRYNGWEMRRIARLNANGTLDTSFNPDIGGYSDGLYSVTIQTDGKIIVGGIDGGTGKGGIKRLEPNGNEDTTFNNKVKINSSGAIYATSMQTDGKIIIAGDFYEVNGVRKNSIARLNQDGTLDTSFNSGQGTFDQINTIALLRNGKIVIGGDFNQYDGVPRKNIARLNSDGSLDVTFNPGTGTNGFIKACAVQRDDKIVVAGLFTEYDGSPISHIARIEGEGIETSFKVTEHTTDDFLHLSPNPSPGTFTLSLPEGAPAKGSYIITDLTGRTVYTGPLTGSQTTVQLNVPAGIYFAVIETGGNKVVKRVVVKE